MHLAALPRCYAVVALLVSILSRAVADCNHNNCLRAVIGNAFPTRNGVGDCNSYLLTTVTPATSTFYATTTIVATASTTATEVDGFTTVIVIPATTTSIQSTTETQYTVDTVTTSTSVTTVIEETITTTSNVATVVVTETHAAAANAPRGQMEPRQVTATPTAIPAYASSCPSPAAYVSACLCFGATARTITAAAPSTTITVPTTSYTTSTILNTISTTSTQSSTSTATVVETDTATSTVVESATDLVTLTISDTATKVILGTTTTTTTTTTMANSCPSPTLQNGGFESGNTATPWVYSNFGNDLSAGVDTASTGDFTPNSGSNYFEVTNDESPSKPIEARLAQSPYFCTGVAYKITLSASGGCNGKSCAGSHDLYIQIATLQAFSSLFYVQTNSQSEYMTFTWTFTWTGGNGLNSVLVDMFINGEGESLSVDDISIGFA